MFTLAFVFTNTHDPRYADESGALRPWYNRDRTCTTCPEGSFIDNGTIISAGEDPAEGHTIKQCQAWTESCSINEFYVNGTGSTTSDRECRSCEFGSEMPFSDHLNTSCTLIVAEAAASEDNTSAITGYAIGGLLGLMLLLLLLVLIALLR